MRYSGLIGLTLAAMMITSCDAVSIVSRAEPTKAPLPTVAPTLPPTPTVPPTATVPPATPTNANPLDALRKIFGTSNVKSFRGKVDRTSGTTTTESTFEAVLPDRFHIIAKGSETIIIGQTLYTKKGTQWTKIALPQGFDLSFANWKKLLDDLGAATDVKFIGADVLDGAPMLVYQYTVTFKGPPVLTSTSKVWVAVSDNLPRKSDTTTSAGTHSVTTFSDYNANIVIEAPIK